MHDGSPKVSYHFSWQPTEIPLDGRVIATQTKQQGERKVIAISTGNGEKRVFVANADCLTLGRSNVVVEHCFHIAKLVIFFVRLRFIVDRLTRNDAPPGGFGAVNVDVAVPESREGAADLFDREPLKYSGEGGEIILSATVHRHKELDFNDSLVHFVS